MTQYLMIGEVLKPQGLKGEAKVRPYAADTDAFHSWKTLYLCDNGAYSPIACRCTRIHEGFAYLVLGDCACLEDVDKLRGRELYIDRAHAAPLAEGEYYIEDLIGCRAVDEDGKEIGVLTQVLQNGPVDVYVFRTRRGNMMAPALKAAFPTVDPESKTITVISDRLQEIAVWNN